MSCWFFNHDWSKWESYTTNVKEGMIWQDIDSLEWSSQLRQRRTCNKCGKTQDEKVR